MDIKINNLIFDKPKIASYGLIGIGVGGQIRIEDMVKELCQETNQYQMEKLIKELVKNSDFETEYITSKIKEY